MSTNEFLPKKILKKLDYQTQRLIDRTGSDRKTLDQVFDKPTLLLLGKFISNGVIDYVDFPISTGKEANVFRCVTPDNTFLAMKIFRIDTLTFKHINKYLVGDPRFKHNITSRRSIIFEWTKKEYRNLTEMQSAGIRVPRPLSKRNNILLMEYIGTKNKPAPQLKDVVLKDPAKVLNELITFIKKMYTQAGLIHADLSAYNILYHKNKPYLIDVGQSVLLEHPNASDYLKRDIDNLLTYFSKYNIKKDKEKLYQSVLKSRKAK